MEKGIKIALIILSIIIVVLLIWGLIGSSKSAEIGITCDTGLGQDGSVFCWQWHKNIVGEIGDTIDNIFNK